MKKELKTLKDTEKLATQIANKLKGGSIMALVGELGAGKTTFVQALARALGVKRVVKSPTFTVLQTYKTSGGLTLCHVDAYRISDPQELEALGFFDYLNDPNTITVIEWANRIKDALPKHTAWIELAVSNNNRSANIINLTKV